MSDLLARLAKLPPEKRRLLEQRLKGDAQPAAAELRPRPRDGGPLRLSFAQERLWFLDQLQPGTAAYNMPYPLRVRGGLDVAALQRALSEIVRRHETLRTRFGVRDDDPVQYVDPARPVRLPVVDLGGLEEGASERELERLSAEEASRPFDLERGPLLRAVVARLGDADAGVLFTLHHIVSDGWSLGVLEREVSALYGAYASGETTRLPELPVQYADYAAWQRERLSGESLEKEVGYWREALADAPSHLDLPTDRPRPPVADDAGGHAAIFVDAATAAGLRALGQREGATAFMTLLAGWQLLLSRYSGQEDVLVGTPVAGRSRVEVEGLIGFFVNTLVLRGDLSGGPTFRELLHRARERTLGAFAHQEVPFEKLVEELGVERSLSTTPLFQAMFVLQNDERSALDLGGTGLEQLGTGSGAAKFDLTLGIAEDGDRIEGGISYRTELWERATMERMAGHFARVLAQVAADPERRLSQVALVDEAERAQVLREWNETGPAYAGDACVHDLFSAQAARTPEAVAVVHAGEAVRYGELERAANQLAHTLRRRGVGPEVTVGVCLRRTPRALAALLGVLKAGGAYVPLDPAHPAERMAFMLEDAAVRLVLTEEALAERIPAGVELLSLDAEADALAREPETAPESGVRGENLSHVIFTSGSTGRPKGVTIRHRATAVFVRWIGELVPEEEWSSVLGSTSFSFDVSVAEIFGTLCRGGKLVLVENALELTSVSDEDDVRLVVTVPTAAAELVRMGGIPRSVRAFNLAGEALSAELAAALYGLEHVEHVRNLYGPTEDTTYSTYAPVERGAEQVRIGRAMAGSRTYVLDGELEPQAVGVAGELYLAGEGLARGYAGRPDLTAERFLPDPYGPAGSRMYRGLDVARWRTEGELEYLGRADQQVKVRGFRIELGEIEVALERHGGVAETVVVAREEEGGEKRLVAYVVPAGVEVDAGELRAHLRGSLPEYMVPTAYVTLERLPLTTSGKIDRRALPAPEGPGLDAAVYVAPRTPTEEILAGTWAEVLGAARVGVTEDFFALGGHSLLATRVISRVRQSFGVELPLRALFEAPTVAGLARRIEVLSREEQGTQAPPLVPVHRDGTALPLSFAQQRLWLVDRLQPESAAYNMPFALRVRGGLDVGALERALTEIVRRHETLRTRFGVEAGDPVQLVDPARPVRLPVMDLGVLSDEAREEELERRVAEEAARPFDLATGPLLRASVVRLGDGDAAVMLTLHHIVSDGWSMEVLVREVSELYEAYAAGEDLRLPELPVQYADYAVWQRGWLTGEVLEREIGYWRETLAGAPPHLELPTDRPRPAVSGGAGAHQGFRLPEGTTAGLRALARREGATAFMALLAGWQLLLSRYSGEEDVLVGTPVAGRSRLEVEGLIGFFVNTLVLRGDLSGEPTFRDLLHRARERTLGAFAHPEVPFEKLVEELGVERSLAHTPLFQVMFSLQAESRDELSLGETRLEALGGGGSEVKFDLTLALLEGAEGVRGALAYRTELWEPAAMERLAGHLSTLLAGVVAEPERPVSEIPLLDASERAQLLGEWSTTESGTPSELPLHERIAAVAARTPGAAAVLHGDAVVTYGELERRAEALAGRLRARGVGLEARVGLSVERSAELLVGMLAIWKAGGAYVPLDPSYPAERLAYMVRDSGAPLVVTTDFLAAEWEARGVPVLRLDAERADSGPTAVSVSNTDSSADALVYVIYTSGSTGEPKGVMVSHRSAGNHLDWIAGEVLGEEVELLPATTRASFDASLKQLVGPLLRGRAVWILPEDTVADPVALLDALQGRTGIAFNCVPSLWSAMLDAAERGAGAPTGVRRLLLGGEAFGPELLERSRALLPGLKVWNLYGPTETTVNASAGRVEAGAVPGVGRPVGNARAYVLDRGGEPAPVGVPGELYVGGVGVARGYLGRPGATAEKFVPDPFGSEPGARLYRTGDRMRWRADGTLEFLGRGDAQVKIRGFRIEPGEVEAALEGQDGVKSAVVVAREDGRGGLRLVGYYETAAGAEVTADGLRSGLRAALPEHMVPSALVELEALPLTPNGKVDRRALPEPEAAGEAEYVGPRTPVEEVLTGIWAEVLGAERVGVTEDFFALGGHSLLAVQLMARVEQAFGERVPLAALFTASTVERLAVALRRGAASRAGRRLVPIRPEGKGNPLFLVHPAGGSVLCYAGLARVVDGDRPVYGLQAAGLDGAEPPLADVAGMAAAYLEAVREVQPAGPYLLGGWSLGGLVAFEMARQAEAAGERVEFLALFDAILHDGSVPSAGDDEEREVDAMLDFARHLDLPVERLAVSREEAVGMDTGGRLDVLLDLARATGTLPPGFPSVLFRSLWDVYRAGAAARRAYVPAGPVSAPVLFLRADARELPPEADPSLGWARLAAGGIQVETVPGGHFDLLREPGLQAVAEHLVARLGVRGSRR